MSRHCHWTIGCEASCASLGKEMVWMAIPSDVIVGWVYIVMEMIGECDVSKPIDMKNGVLMRRLFAMQFQDST